jgi:hypothetical protein
VIENDGIIGDRAGQLVESGEYWMVLTFRLQLCKQMELSM